MNNTKKITLTALFIALIALSIAYLFHIPFGAQGYFHLGDSFIFIASVMLPLPYSVIAAAIGGTLGDILSGGYVWAIWTLVIKGVIAFSFSYKSMFISKRNIFALVIALFITLGGYYIAEGVITGNFVVALTSLWGNAAQWFFSAAVYLIVGKILDKRGCKFLS